MYSLRAAKKEDLHFLFEVSTKAMLPIRKLLDPNLQLDLEKEFKDYAKKFVAEKIQVIQFNGLDVGRLRVVRSADEIYIGGIQILPEFQNKGIGSAIFADLIKEANELKIPIKLEVAKVNEVAKKFYKKLGFVKADEKGTDWLMEYQHFGHFL